eukprot:13912246-Alexandrium_andersonii.AAC.1
MPLQGPMGPPPKQKAQPIEGAPGVSGAVRAAPSWPQIIRFFWLFLNPNTRVAADGDKVLVENKAIAGGKVLAK